jgi:phosphoglycerate dehydrogenase-like enzyme
VEGIDLDACRRRGVAVANLRGNDADEMAEHAIALMLSALRRVPELDRALRAGRWSNEMIRGARGLTLGVVGLGAIGGRTAALGRALGMDVLAWSFGPDDGRAARAGATPVDLDVLLRRSDVVSLHLRVSDATRSLIDSRRFGLMKPDAVLVNTARAALVDRAALIQALTERRIAAAGLDVFHTEPVPPDDPLLTLPNVVLTPHAASNIAHVVARGLMTAVANIDNFLKGNPTNLVVDPR